MHYFHRLPSPIQFLSFLLLASLGFDSRERAFGQELVDLAPWIEKSRGQISQFWLVAGVANTTQSWESPDPFPMEGQVIEVNDRELIYVPVNKEKPVAISGDQLVAIKIAWGSEEAKQAHQLFIEKKYLEAAPAAQKALSSGVLKWQQRALVAEMVYSLRAAGRLGPSGDVFLKLAKEHPSMIFYASIPLAWQTAKIEKSSLDKALKWIEDTDESAKLLGASWLLAGDERSRAVKTLEELTKSKNSQVQKLATTQLWRIVPAGEVASQRLTEWSQYRDAMLPPAQWGPTLLIADKLDQAGKTDLAIPEWIRFAVLHRDHPQEVESCIDRAAKFLNAAGNSAEAKQVLSLK